MFGFLFRSTTYYILWKKFNKQIVLIVLSVVFIALLQAVYADLFDLLKVSHKESLIGLFLGKWILIIAIVLYNIHKLKQIKLDDADKEEVIKAKEPEPPKEIQELLAKKRLKSTTDRIIEKYKKER